MSSNGDLASGDRSPVSTQTIRVAAYVIRRAPHPQLLTFDHVDAPEAGRQVPAGGAYPHEDLTEAVLRELAEETGLTTVTLVRALTTEDKPHPTTGHPRRTTFFHLEAPTTTADSWLHRVTGTGGDNGMLFACQFVPLPLARQLTDNQDAWLGRISPSFVTDVPGSR